MDRMRLTICGVFLPAAFALPAAVQPARAAEPRQNPRYRDFSSNVTPLYYSRRSTSPFAPRYGSTAVRTTVATQSRHRAATSSAADRAVSPRRPSGRQADSGVSTVRRAKFDPLVAEEALLNFMERKILSVSYESMTLEDVLTDFRQKTGVNMVALWPQMELAGYDKTLETSVTLQNVSAETLLDAILDYASAGAQAKLDWIGRNGVITIGLAEELPRQVITEIYYVGDLTQRRSDSGNASLVDSSNFGSAFGQSGTSGGGGGNQRDTQRTVNDNNSLFGGKTPEAAQLETTLRSIFRNSRNENVPGTSNPR